MAHQMHLSKSGSGMSIRTACGRNILRTPMSMNWAGFSALPTEQRCAKCNASKQAEVNARMEARKAAEAAPAPAGEYGEWEPLPDDAWKAADDALIAAHRAKQANRI